jgi:hypothetical protein
MPFKPHSTNPDMVIYNPSDYFIPKWKNEESAINCAGLVVTISTEPNIIKFEKGHQFDIEMESTQGVIADDGTHITTAENRRKWMHKKLDAWIDKEKNT